MFQFDAGTERLGPKRYISISGADIKLINWNGVDVSDVRQIVHGYDVRAQCRTGFILTDTCTKEIAKLNWVRKKSFYTGNLYIKAYDNKYGLWELTLTDTHIKEIASGVTWFKHDGVSSLKILKKSKV